MSDTTSIRKFDRKTAKAQASARIKEEMTPPIRQLTLLVAVISMVATELLSVLSESSVNGFLVLLISIVLDIVLMLFLSGYTVYIMKVARVQPGAGYPDLKYGFGPMAGKLILLMIETAVRVYLWALLFVIPGLVAIYRYRFSLYILIDNPDISAGEAIRRRKAMTQGRKDEQLALDLSFHRLVYPGRTPADRRRLYRRHPGHPDRQHLRILPSFHCGECPPDVAHHGLSSGIHGINLRLLL